MKIRSHLLLLVTAALLPLLVFGIALTAYSWRQERSSLEVRQLERVRAVTIALDTELQATIRVLRVLGTTPGMDPAKPQSIVPLLRATIGSQPLWSVLAVGDPEWRNVQAVLPVGEMAASPGMDEGTRQRALKSGMPAISGLVRDGPRAVTQIVVPVIQEGAVAALLMVSVDAHEWLGFMGQYPVANGAILTLVDQNGLVIARTLNNDRWVGSPASKGLLDRSRESAEAAFRNVTLEGNDFYTAYSRSLRWGWTVATGIPAETVEAALRTPSWLLATGAALSILLAVLLATFIGRRIAGPIAALGPAARALEREEKPRVPLAGNITEVREVAHAFDEAGSLLAERRRALSDSLAAEQRARQEAEQASRAKDEFLAMLGHELRNPLNAISSAVAVIHQVPPGSDRARRSHEIVDRQIVHLRELVDDLLDVARVTSGKIALRRETMDLARVARHVTAVMNGAGRFARHALEVDCDEAWICGDDTRIEQIVTNLLDNAVKYTPAGGRIAVRVFTDGDESVLAVEDSGMGIDPALLPRVFELFTQDERALARSEGGLGIGLSLVRRLVELHGGRVEAASAGKGRGARFVVRFQRHAAPAGTGQVSAANDEHERHLRVLIVEDNPDGRETLAMMLSLQGHEVHEAEDGPTGVDCALKVHPDAAIVDIGLPGFDGYEVARRLRAANDGHHIRLVALTGYGQEEDRQNAFQAGFDAFLVKPADLDALSRILKAA